MNTIGAHISQLCHPVQDIGQVPQLILQFLGCRIRRAREKSECCDICEVVTFVEQAQITAENSAVCHNLGRLDHIRRDMEAGRKVIGRAGRNIADGDKRLFGILHHAAHDLIQRTVSARADHIQVIVPPFPYDTPCISPCPRGITDNLILRSREDIKNIHHIIPDLRTSCNRIKDKQNFLPGVNKPVRCRCRHFHFIIHSNTLLYTSRN